MKRYRFFFHSCSKKQNPAWQRGFVFLNLFHLKMLVRLHAAGAYFDAGAVHLSCPLEIWVSSSQSSWVELSSTNSVAVSATYLRTFITNCTNFSHDSGA
jgi:hypothetical protein